MKNKNECADGCHDEPKKKKRANYQTVRIVIDDYLTVSNDACQILVKEGYAEADAVELIRRVWAIFQTRKYSYTQSDDWHKVSYPSEFYVGALVFLAKNHQRFESQEDFEQACRRNLDFIHDAYSRFGHANATLTWVGSSRETDYILGQIEEARNQIKEYLSTYNTHAEIHLTAN